MWRPEGYAIAWCNRCFAPRSYPVEDMDETQQKEATRYKTYFHSNDWSRLYEIVVQFPDGLYLNAAWGDFAPQNIVIVKNQKTEVLRLFRTDIGFKPDADYLHQRIKTWITFS